MDIMSIRAGTPDDNQAVVRDAAGALLNMDGATLRESVATDISHNHDMQRMALENAPLHDSLCAFIYTIARRSYVLGAAKTIERVAAGTIRTGTTPFTKG